MEPLKQLNQALQYLEEHLLEEPDYAQLARIAGCSDYHFRRMFSFLAGLPVTEYLRRRRLSQAGLLLQQSERKVIEVALDFGYSSPDAFGRAFQALHGITPSQAKQGRPLQLFPPLHFRLNIQGGDPMQYRIIEKEAFTIVGIKERITLIYEGTNPQIDAMWGRLTPDDYVELKRYSNLEPQGILCVSADFAAERVEGSELDQYIGVATSHSDLPARWTQLAVEAGTWAVFTAVGPFPDALQTLWARIYGEWFPSAGYEFTGGPEILWNESPDTSKPDYKSEIWIPVVKA